ncbi:four-carbon acid sugar kinase family protein [uncultured Cohaesibacter sp.]|uniref:four-carbon acid sugar kinase family protein n=1 Tax=uncultured Cohaesibacter sp. TaxID=1002546 RepID=UPI0029C88CDD|nr:four-carbon acid sugar kinase family protein [uncultured Cohaesibacter sp.]
MIEGEKLAIIADDFTGAGDAGIHFARSGSRAELLLHISALEGAPLNEDAIAITTETRFLSPADAASVVARTIGLCQSSGYHAIYKKIDSTMRGNPGAEIEAALSVTGQSAAIICPAMPETGRTCVGGVIWLNGEPLHRSDIGSDPFHPLETSEIAEILKAQTTLPIGVLDLDDIEAGSIHMAERVRTLIAEGVRLITADATTIAHLQALARLVMSENLLPVGAGGFARAVAAEWAKGKKGRPETAPVHGPLLAIVGSLAPISLSQAKQAKHSGLFTSIQLSAHDTLEDMKQKCATALSHPGAEGLNVLLHIADDADKQTVSKQDGERVAALLGAAAVEICGIVPCKTVYSTGGSTSIAVAQAFGIQSVSLVNELLPGVVLGICESNDKGIEGFISKAGGFGEKDLLLTIASRIVQPCLAAQV